MEQLKVKWVYKRKYLESKYIDFFSFVVDFILFYFYLKKKTVIKGISNLPISEL